MQIFVLAKYSYFRQFFSYSSIECDNGHEGYRNKNNDIRLLAVKVVLHRLLGHGLTSGNTMRLDLP